MSGQGHNSKTSFAQGQLRSLVERIERLNEDRKAIEEDLKQVYGECKAFGFDKKIVKIVVAHRAKDPAELQETEALVDLYKAALGMIPDSGEPVTPTSQVEAPDSCVNGGDDVSTHAGTADAQAPEVPGPDRVIPGRTGPSCTPGEPAAKAVHVSGKVCAPPTSTSSAAAGSAAPAPHAVADATAGGKDTTPPAVDPSPVWSPTGVGTPHGQPGRVE